MAAKCKKRKKKNPAKRWQSSRRKPPKRKAKRKTGRKPSLRTVKKALKELMGQGLVKSKKVGGKTVYMWAGKNPPLGTGERFAQVVREIERRNARIRAARKRGQKVRGKIVRDPRAVAAWIGRRKYGKKKFQQLAARGRWRKKAARAKQRRKKVANPRRKKAATPRKKKKGGRRRKKSVNPTRAARIAKQLKRYPKSDALRQLHETIKWSRRSKGQKKRRRRGKARRTIRYRRPGLHGTEYITARGRRKPFRFKKGFIPDVVDMGAVGTNPRRRR